MWINGRRINLTLSKLLVVLLPLAPIVGAAQQSQSQTATLEQKQTAQKLGGERPAVLAIESDDRLDAKLAVYQVHRIAEKILALRNVRVKALETARLASALWKQDETHSRFLFEKALNLTIPTAANGTDAEARALSALHRRVIALIARSDAEWAKRLIDSVAKREAEEKGLQLSNAANISTALGLLADDPPVAVQFAERSLKTGVHPAFVDFVLTLRKTDESEANRLFLQGLHYLSQQPTVDIQQFHALGLYLFTAQDLIEPDARVLTLVEDILVPNITLDRPGVPPALVRTYLATAADVLWRMTSDAEQRKFSYALCYLLLPKARLAAPELTTKFDAVMAALAPQVPSNLTKDSAFRYMNATPSSAEEQLTKAENKPDQEGRDMAHLEIILQSWRKGDFKTARIAQARISDLDVGQRLAAIIDFGNGAWVLKQPGPDLAKAETMANRLPQGIERSILLQAIAKAQGKGAAQQLSEEIVDKALKAARSINDGRRPFLLLTAAAQLANLKSASVHSAVAEAVRDFNSFEETNLSRLDWAQVIQIGALPARFPLDVANIDFNFNQAFRNIALADPEAAMARAEELRHENLRAQSLVEVGRVFLERLPANPSKTQLAIRVGEDGIRKSASKTIMPSYPEDALKKREQGVAVIELQYDAKGDVIETVVLESPSKSIGDSVVKAIQQWKFVPSKKQDGTAVSVRGKLTFYFEIDKDGKGMVQNPKQFR